MKRLKTMLACLVLLALAGCAAAGTGAGASAGSSALPPQVFQPDSSASNPESGEAESGKTGPMVTIHNSMDGEIEQIFLVRENTAELLAETIGPHADIVVEWPDSSNFNSREAAYFVLHINGQEIPITTARLVSSDARQELYFTFKEIAFFYEDDTYFFSTQADYLNKKSNPEAGAVCAQYIYLPQVYRWLHQSEGQLLFAVGLSESKIREYFPDFEGDISYMPAAVVSCETIYLEDVRLDTPDFQTLYETRRSNDLVTFTPEDVMVISVDHVRDFRFYYRYLNEEGNVHRQYVADQARDSNNNSIVNIMLYPDDPFYTLVLAD